MPRPEEVEVVEAMKAAVTGEEVLASWAKQRPGYGKPRRTIRRWTSG